MIIENKELINIVGGATNVWSGSYINAISRLISLLIDVGRAVGSAFRYKKSGLTC